MELLGLASLRGFLAAWRPVLYWGYMGNYWIVQKKMETTIVYGGYIGIMEKKMETTIVYWGYMRIMGKKMEITIVYLVL